MRMDPVDPHHDPPAAERLFRTLLMGKNMIFLSLCGRQEIHMFWQGNLAQSCVVFNQ